MKKLMMFLLVGILFLGTLSGCGSSANNQVGTTTAEVKETTEAVKTQEAPVEIEFFNRKVQAKDVVESIAKKFNEKFPNITIKVNTPTGSAQDGNDPFAVRVASGDIPEIFTDWPVMPEFVARARGGIMMDLTGQAFLGNINRSVLDILTVDKKDYSMPISLNTTGVAYNKKLFEQNNWKVPTTYGELIALCKQITATGINAFALGDKDAWTIGHMSQGLYNQSIPDHLNFWLDIAKETKKAKDSPELRKVAEHLLELRQYGQKDNLGAGYDAQINDFATGKAAMVWQGNWAIDGIRKANPELEFEYFAFPADTAEATEVIVGIDYALCVSAQAKSPDQSLKFLEFFSTPEVAQMYADVDGAPMSVNGVVSKTKEMVLLNKIIESGKTGSWSVGAWAPGMEVEMANVLQNLIAHKDVNKFLDEIDALLGPTDPPEAR